MSSIVKKQIKYIEDGVEIVKEMTLEEVLVKYDNLLWSFAKKCEDFTKSIRCNINTKEDYYQEGVIVLVNCYNTYECIHAFSTLLFISLKQKLISIYSYYKHKNRENKFHNTKSIYENDSKDEKNNCRIIDIIKDDADNIDKKEFNIDLDLLCGYLTDREEKIVRYLFIENMNKKEVGKILNITQPTLRKYEKITKEKCAKIITHYFPEYALDHTNTYIEKQLICA